MDTRAGSTLDKSLWGGEGWTANTAVKLVQQYGVSDEVAQHLSKTYGTRAVDVCELSEPTGKAWPRFGKLLVDGYPYIECEVTFACMEYARTVTDVLTLRTRLAFENSGAALSAAPRVSEIMARYLGWSETERLAQLEEANIKLAEFGP